MKSYVNGFQLSIVATKLYILAVDGGPGYASVNKYDLRISSMFLPKAATVLESLFNNVAGL